MHQNPIEEVRKNLASCNQLVREFVQASNQGSGMAVFAEFIKATVGAPDQGPEADLGKVKDKVSKEVVTNIEAGFERHISFLCSAGLELHYTQRDSADRLTGMPKPTITVCDGERYAGFWERLALLHLGEGDMKSLAVLANCVQSQFHAACATSTSSPEAAELLESFARISDAYERIGFGAHAQDIRESLEYHDKSAYEALITARELREKINSGFSPARWHEDSSIEWYEGKWKGLVEQYRQISDCTPAWELRSEAYERLAAEAEAAIEALERLRDEKGPPPSEYLGKLREKALEYLKIVCAAQAQLEQLRSGE